LRPALWFHRNVQQKYVCDRNDLATDLRLRLLSNSKLVISRNGHGSRHAHIGRARKRSVEGIPVPELGREYVTPLSIWTVRFANSKPSK
jgi:hypothetical protein